MGPLASLERHSLQPGRGLIFVSRFTYANILAKLLGFSQLPSFAMSSNRGTLPLPSLFILWYSYLSTLGSTLQALLFRHLESGKGYK